MLVVACYSSERSLFLSFAMRMALDLKLQETYGELAQRLSMRDAESVSRDTAEFGEAELSLMWKSRTWLGLLVLEHMFAIHIPFLGLSN